VKNIKQLTTFVLLAGLLLFLGCAAHSPFDRSYVSDSIYSRSGFEIASVADSLLLPPDVDPSDGISEDEAIALAQNATISPLGETKNMQMPATPVGGPPLSNPSNASSDLYYKLNNEAGDFRIGQKVMVSLMLTASQQHTVIPYSAILYDMYASAWVYVQTAPLIYKRQRLQMSHVVENMAVIARGLQAGDEVVIAGGMELFGTEFGGGK
jgi:hypothetical protein